MAFINQDQSDESKIIENSADDTLYKNELANGSWTFFNVQSNIDDNIEEIESEIQISPKIRVSIFYVKRKLEIWSIKIQKFKKVWWWKWEEQEKISLAANWIETLKDILSLLNTIDLWKISERKISLWSTLEWIEIDEDTKKQLRLIFSKDEWVDLVQEIIDTKNAKYFNS